VSGRSRVPSPAVRMSACVGAGREDTDATAAGDDY
jgi:hypothetical protein